MSILEVMIAGAGMLVASVIALWSVWLGYNERRKRLTLEKRLVDAAADYARRESMAAYTSANTAASDADLRAAKEIADGVESSDLAEYLRNQR